MSPVRLELQRGDIVSVRADVCVSSIHRSKDMSRGPLARHILKCGGNSIQDELMKRDPGVDLKLCQLEVIQPGKLRNFKELNFICLQNYQPGHEETLLQTIIECLELATVKNHKSVAFPAVGAGHGYPVEKVASCLVEAVTLHNCQYPETSLEVVYVVLRDQDVDVIKTFLLMCVRGTTDLPPDAKASSDEVPDLEDSMTDLQIDGIHKFDSWHQQEYSGGVKSGAPQMTTTLPPNKPKVMGQKKKPPKQGNQPPIVNQFLSNLVKFFNGVGYSANVGHFNFNIKPNISNRRIGIQVNLGLDTSFTDEFILPQLQKFWQSITR
ncbi:hypothetical protein BsWGS_26328 [Bradybaena similaris]